MIKVHKVIASFFGIGFIGKGGGTIAAVVTCLIWLTVPSSDSSDHWKVLSTILVCGIGVWSGNVVDAQWGKDSSKVVIDEVAGMMITLLLMPVTLPVIVAGLILFRFYDIAKPLYIRRLEKLPKGIGVMADDILAGIYAHITLWLLLKSNIL